MNGGTLSKGIYRLTFYGTGAFFLENIEKFIGRLMWYDGHWKFSAEESGDMTEGCTTAGEAVLHILRRSDSVSEGSLNEHATFVLGMMVELSIKSKKAR